MTIPPTPQPAGGNPDGYGIRRYGTTGGVSGGMSQPGFNISSDGRGLLEGTAVLLYEVNPSLPRLPDIPRRGEAHPTDSRLKCYKADASFNNLGECRVTASYIGLAKDPTDGQIEITGSTAETSIVFHPDFPEWAIASPAKQGTKDKPAKPMEFKPWVEKDDNNNFVRFKIGVTPGDLGGVEAYLTPRAVVRTTYYTGSTNLVKSRQGGLGRASAIPGCFPSSLTPKSGANWLLTNVSVSEYGNVYKITEEWTMSESGKPWNQYIYGKGKGAGSGGLGWQDSIGGWKNPATNGFAGGVNLSFNV